MGNTQSGYPLTRTVAALDSFVSELGSDIVYEKRCVKDVVEGPLTVLISHTGHQPRHLTIPQDSTVYTPQWFPHSQDIHQARPWMESPEIPEEIEECVFVFSTHPTDHDAVARLMMLYVSSFDFVLLLCTVEREALLDIPNVYNYQTFVETDKAGYLIRQWVASNLYDRIRCVQFLLLLS